VDAQNLPQAPDPGQPLCEDGRPASTGCGASSGSSSSGTSDPISAWKDRIAAMSAARKKHKAEMDAKNAEKQRAKANAKADAEAARQRQIAAEQQRLRDAEHQRQLAEEARRLQDTFNRIRPTAVGELKDADRAPGSSSGFAGGLDLKDADDAPALNPPVTPSWTTSITDPNIKPHAQHLASIVPPPPIPPEEAKLSLEMLFNKVTGSAAHHNYENTYLGDERLAKTAELVVAGFEIAGTLGKTVVFPAHAVMIFGKTFIAGEDGAYLHLIKNEHDYEAAAAYLKDPALSQRFAHLVDDLHKNLPLPEGADPGMVQAARAITDPKLGNSGRSMAWDAITSPEAVSAMMRKAIIESTLEFVAYKADPVIESFSERKLLFDTVSAERAHAVEMIASKTASQQEKAQWKILIDRSDKLIAGTYAMEKVERTGAAAGAKLLGDGSDRLAGLCLGKTESPEYGQPEHRSENE
jgi:hypothetical protein